MRLGLATTLAAFVVGALASPAALPRDEVSTQVTFCSPMSPPPSQEELDARFAAFAQAFLVEKDIDEAFSYIAPSYINHNPFASDGAQNAYNILAPIWPGLQITFLRSKIEGNMSWVNYRVNLFGEVVDRFRWENGCIAEHWDQGEQYPPDL